MKRAPFRFFSFAFVFCAAKASDSRRRDMFDVEREPFGSSGRARLDASVGLFQCVLTRLKERDTSSL